MVAWGKAGQIEGISQKRCSYERGGLQQEGLAWAGVGKPCVTQKLKKDKLVGVDQMTHLLVPCAGGSPACLVSDDASEGAGAIH